MRPPRASWVRSALAGAPLLVFVAGGAFVLAQFTRGTVEARDLRNKSRSVRQFTLEEEHAKIERRLRGADTGSGADLVLKRIPRPPEN